METQLGARQRRRPPTVHRGSTHAPRLQRPVAREDEASTCSELRLGCHPETPVIEPCLSSSLSQAFLTQGHHTEPIAVVSGVPGTRDVRGPRPGAISCPLETRAVPGIMDMGIPVDEDHGHGICPG